MSAPVAAVAGQMLSRGSVDLVTAHGAFAAHVFQNLGTGRYAIALVHGDVSGPEPLLVRVHSSCLTSETFGGCDCDCVDQLDLALARIAAAGRGVVFYLMQEGRGAGFTAKARDRMMVQASRQRLTTFEAYERMGLGRDHRRYDEIAPLRRALGITAPLLLLTNNPEKLGALGRLDGVPIAGSARLRQAASSYNLHYLAAKSRSGHALGDPGAEERVAELPEPVRDFPPYILPGEPRFVHLATYLLPLRPGGARLAGGPPHWFRVHAYFDLTGGREHVVLAYGPPEAPRPLIRVQRESWLERFPLAAGGRHKLLWEETVRELVRHGAGYAAFVSVAGFDAALRERWADDEPAVALLAHHVRGRTARPILASAPSDRRGAVDGDAAAVAAEDRAVAAALARRGVRLEPALRIGGGRAPVAPAAH